jgi:hypothetical protein
MRHIRYGERCHLNEMTCLRGAGRKPLIFPDYHRIFKEFSRYLRRGTRHENFTDYNANFRDLSPTSPGHSSISRTAHFSDCVPFSLPTALNSLRSLSSNIAVCAQISDSDSSFDWPGGGVPRSCALIAGASALTYHQLNELTSINITFCLVSSNFKQL